MRERRWATRQGAGNAGVTLGSFLYPVSPSASPINSPSKHRRALPPSLHFHFLFSATHSSAAPPLWPPVSPLVTVRSILPTAAPAIFLKQKSDHFTSLLKTLQWLLVTLSPMHPGPSPVPLPATGTFFLLTKCTERIPPQDLWTSCALCGMFFHLLFGWLFASYPLISAVTSSERSPLTAQGPPTTSSYVHSALMVSLFFCGFVYCPLAHPELHESQGCLVHSVPCDRQTPGPPALGPP